jgi:hypothetical protein
MNGNVADALLAVADKMANTAAIGAASVMRCRIGRPPPRFKLSTYGAVLR